MKTKMKSIIFTAIIILYSVELSAQKKWTLNECIERAINKNISIKQSKADLKSTSLNKTTAIANFLPSINLASSHSWNVGLNQNITTGLLENMTTTSKLNYFVTTDLELLHKYIAKNPKMNLVI